MMLRRDWIRTNDLPVRLSPDPSSIQLSYAAAASTKPDAKAEQERGVSNMPVKGMKGRGNTWDARLSAGLPIPVLSNKTRPLGPNLRGMLGRRFRGNI